MSRFKFIVNTTYTRDDVKRATGADPSKGGGIWATGYVQHAGADFIFCGVGTPGRTGHDYGNYFDGDELVWRGNTHSHKGQPGIQRMTSPGTEVHVFWREGDRDPFNYAGLATAVTVSNETPVRVRWRFSDCEGGSLASADEVTVPPGTVYREGALKQVLVNMYERNPQARLACIRHHGASCKVCGFDFKASYGVIGVGFIHVHHRNPMAATREAYTLDPVRDLVPVCPNCHAMLHRANPPLTVEQLTEAMRGRAGAA